MLTNEEIDAIRARWKSTPSDLVYAGQDARHDIPALLDHIAELKTDLEFKTRVLKTRDEQHRRLHTRVSRQRRELKFLNSLRSGCNQYYYDTFADIREAYAQLKENIEQIETLRSGYAELEAENKRLREIGGGMLGLICAAFHHGHAEGYSDCYHDGPPEPMFMHSQAYHEACELLDVELGTSLTADLLDRAAITQEATPCAE